MYEILYYFICGQFSGQAIVIIYYHYCCLELRGKGGGQLGPSAHNEVATKTLEGVEGAEKAPLRCVRLEYSYRI
jgi:hypothetical protein